MKLRLDRMKLAKLVAHCCGNGMSQGDWEIERIDEFCEFEVPEPVNKASCADIDNLMALMAEGNRKIEAIKAYRTLTGAGLKEGKDAVEKYWLPGVDHYALKSDEPAKLGDILDHASGRNKAGDDISGL